MACRQPQEFLTNAFIQAVAYREPSGMLLTRKTREILLGLWMFKLKRPTSSLKKYEVYAVKEPARREIPQFAMQAVFEALVNAVAHRDYSIQNSKVRLHMFADRLEIFSPGAIPNTMTIESLPLRQVARNELLTSLLARCPVPFADYKGDRNFLMDKRGEGVPIILSESKKLSGRVPEYRQIDDTELLLTIFAKERPQEASGTTKQ